MRLLLQCSRETRVRHSGTLFLIAKHLNFNCFLMAVAQFFFNKEFLNTFTLIVSVIVIFL